MKNKVLIKGSILVIVSAFLFGCMPLITRYIYAAGVNRESVVLLRNLLALPLLALLTYRQEKSFKIPAKAIPAIVAIALMGCCITPLLLYGSYQHIATGTATVFHFVYPAVVVLIGLVFLRKRINAGTLLAVLLCVGGLCLFYNPDQQLDWRGCALALASGVTYAIYVVLLSVFRYSEVSGFRLSFYVSAVCSAAMLAVCLLTGRLTLPARVSGWLLCVLLALVIGVGAVVMFQRGTFLIGGERASVLSTVEPLTGVLMGVVAFQEQLTPAMCVGSVLVISACVLITVFDKKHAAV
ncbi:MAG: EamA/RhaT family transporter [Ruminococcaceae bacterium]|nr:EamA/RhaT family transporter [Oscillospiraceae bacterium]